MVLGEGFVRRVGFEGFGFRMVDLGPWERIVEVGEVVIRWVIQDGIPSSGRRDRIRRGDWDFARVWRRCVIVVVVDGSRPIKGASRRRTSGRAVRALAILARRVWPLERFATGMWRRELRFSWLMMVERFASSSAVGVCGIALSSVWPRR